MKIATKEEMLKAAENKSWDSWEEVTSCYFRKSKKAVLQHLTDGAKASQYTVTLSEGDSFLLIHTALGKILCQVDLCASYIKGNYLIVKARFESGRNSPACNRRDLSYILP